jgi:hypothetical protein
MTLRKGSMELWFWKLLCPESGFDLPSDTQMLTVVIELYCIPFNLECECP